MGPEKPEVFAKCPHCGEPIGVRSLIQTLPLAAASSDPSSSPPPAAAPLAAKPATRPPVISRPVRPSHSPPRPTTRGWRNAVPVRIWKRYFPPVRLVWIFLAILVWNVNGFVNLTVAGPLLLLPIVAVVTDLGLQVTRFPRPRIPDAAIANGLFLSVILWPTTLSLELAAVAAATVGFRHLLRWGGHPLLNPAALGVTIAATVFALPQPWHVGYTLRDSVLIAALGLILWSRARHTWRLWAVFFAFNIGATLALADYLGGAATLPLVIQTSVLGGAPLFYGFFMVTEPRTAPSARWAMILYGVVVGLSAAVLPVALALYTSLSAFGVLTPYLALFVGNLFAAALPSARGARSAKAVRAKAAARLGISRATVDS